MRWAFPFHAAWTDDCCPALYLDARCGLRAWHPWAPAPHSQPLHCRMQRRFWSRAVDLDRSRRPTTSRPDAGGRPDLLLCSTLPLARSSCGQPEMPSRLQEFTPKKLPPAKKSMIWFHALKELDCPSGIVVNMPYFYVHVIPRARYKYSLSPTTCTLRQ